VKKRNDVFITVIDNINE